MAPRYRRPRRHEAFPRVRTRKVRAFDLGWCTCCHEQIGPGEWVYFLDGYYSATAFCSGRCASVGLAVKAGAIHATAHPEEIQDIQAALGEADGEE